MDKIVNTVNGLILRIGQGDKRALEKLYELTGRMMFTMAKKYLIDKTCADDVVSETYLNVVRYAKGFDITKNGLNYMYKAVHNLAVNCNLQKRGVELDESITDSAADIDGWLDDMVVKSALDLLTSQDRQIIYLRYWEGLRLREISERMGVPLSTLSDSIKRILRILRRNIIGKEGDNVK